MRILVVNPNRVGACTELIRQAAQAVASSGTEIVAAQPASGPVELTGQREVLLSAVGVLDCVARLGGEADAVVLAGFGEPGREAAQEIIGAPVLDITECGPALAGLLGRTYTVVTSTERAVPVVADRFRTLGLDGRCAEILPTGLGVPDLVKDRDAAVETIAGTARRASGEVVVLGCGGMAGLAGQVARATGRPVVDGLTAAITCAESLVRLGVRPFGAA
ncbi:aspartate/glutamate racemase family protein [Planotetraspora sp. GP83]|uniref:aspartate/glutamate racemase family protein n=1 Tax=Planotetraspora sp. GP83 TaxID=3156264 RepID=UPI00351954DF